MKRIRGRLKALADQDLAAFDRVARHSSDLGDATLPRLTRLADHSKLWAGIALVLFATRRRRARRGAARGLGSIAVASFFANQIAKRAAPRARPALMDVPLRRVAHRVPVSSSFPSGHSASAAAFAVGVALEMPELALPLGALAAAVGYSRVYTGVHYPGDVIAGAAIGVASAAVVARLVPLPSVNMVSPDSPPPDNQPARPTGAGVVAIVNPSSGPGHGRKPGDRLAEKLRSELPDATVIELQEGQDLLATLRGAAAGAEVLAVAGGDGSINAGAQVAIETNLPLLVLPGGTLNHFAGDLGLRDIADAIAAVRAGDAVRIAVGMATARSPEGGRDIERYFLNTASVGRYPAFVAARERWQGRLGKPLAALVAVRHVLRNSDPVEIDIDGVRRQVALAFVGSNGYEPLGFAPGWRPDLAEGHLDVRLIDFSRRFPRSRFALALLFGRVRFSRQYVELHPKKVVFGLPTDDRLSFDGEVIDIGPRVSFAMRDDALTVFRPSPA